MATMNPFDLLGDDDNDDPSQLLESAAAAAQLQKAAAAAATATAVDAKKMREARNETGRGGDRGLGRGGGRGRGGYSRDYSSNGNAFNSSGAPQGDGEGGRASETERRPYGGSRPPYRGGRRGGFSNEEGRDGDRPRRTYERHSGTGHGIEFKREGSGRGNWGSHSDEVSPQVTEEVAEEAEKIVNAENVPAGEEAVDGSKATQPDETEQKEPEETEMTLEEYEKVLEEKRKALLALKTTERKVEVDKDLQSMQQLSSRRDEESVFIKLASDKDKRKEVSEKEKAKKSVSINEFLKPAEGERYYSSGGRGRGRSGRSSRGGSNGGNGGVNRMPNASAPTIGDQKQFPTLGGAPRS
ncbi:hypothetical protein KSS87_019363 [Heliosperma pusillum]|nr:hypothetical protein KSS87_019363 [Heliosperma pusillum]